MKAQCGKARVGLSFQNLCWSSEQLLVIPKQEPVARQGLGSDELRLREPGGPWGGGLHKPFRPQHAPSLPWVQGLWKVEARLQRFRASLGRFLCRLCLHSRVGEKEWLRRKKQTEERSPGLLTL